MTSKEEFETIVAEEVQIATHSMFSGIEKAPEIVDMGKVSGLCWRDGNGNPILSIGDGSWIFGPPLTEEQLAAREKALAEAAEWEKQHVEEQDRERRKLMRLPRKELERILFYYMCIHDKRSLVAAILEQKEEWEVEE